MTDLGVQHGIFRRAIPEAAGTPAAFPIRGLRIIRTHIYDVPNLEDDVTQRDGIELNPEQHRNGFMETVRVSVAHFYLPQFRIIGALNNRLVKDPATFELNPDSFTHNGNPDRLVVFPDPNIVVEVNESFKGQTLPVQNACPAFSSRVHSADMNEAEMVVPLPRSLLDIAVGQLDKFYYPTRQEEYAAKQQEQNPL